MTLTLFFEIFFRIINDRLAQIQELPETLPNHKNYEPADDIGNVVIQK